VRGRGVGVWGDVGVVSKGDRGWGLFGIGVWRWELAQAVVRDVSVRILVLLVLLLLLLLLVDKLGEILGGGFQASLGRRGCFEALLVLGQISETEIERWERRGFLTLAAME
jgi:hypothetical protein